MFHSRYGLEAQEAEAVVELAKRHQVGLEPAHPVSLFDIWSPNRLLPTEREMLVLGVSKKHQLSNFQDAPKNPGFTTFEKLKNIWAESLAL